MDKTKITIIGAGVIGLACAYELSKSYDDIVVLDRHPCFGQEASSRNSEVIHSGLYYPKDSLKSKTCIEGNTLIYEFCVKNKVSFKKTGKLVVATNQSEIEKIEQLYENAADCGVKNLVWADQALIKSKAPQIRTKKAFFSPDSGLIDTHGFMKALYLAAKSRSAVFSFSSQVVGVKVKKGFYEITVADSGNNLFSFQSEIVINACGLNSDKLAGMFGINDDDYSIDYCKGQYFRIKAPEKFKVKCPVYPPATEISLGIHLTPDLSSGLRLGPDAFYVDEIDYNPDLSARDTFFRSVKSFLPALLADDLIPDTSGIRAKLQSQGQGPRDFIIKSESLRNQPNLINCIGIESPGFTASLSIAKLVGTLL
ncbi:MAG: NAD(P)/FAD-dependent oxidoreductase [Candidatus Omnitrophica bacterium]|nr:NAD(P)/FAD-dependent oxidoreductase [Candidatus Omnitrophota bacterium]